LYVVVVIIIIIIIMSRPRSIPINRLIEVGKRVRLLRAVAGNYELREGDEGTIIDISKLPESLGGMRQIWVLWKKSDGGNYKMAVVEGEDRFTVLD
jgi:hypothetical protein